jgi:hypothetical protein
MRREVILGLTLIGFGTIVAYVASPRVTTLERAVALPAQAPMVPRPSPQLTASLDQSPVVVVTVPQHRSTQSGGVRTDAVQSHSLSGEEFLLARTLQIELQRVGCYDREINGIWTTSSRMAMQIFLERVNAALPFDEPNVILRLLAVASG